MKKIILALICVCLIKSMPAQPILNLAEIQTAIEQHHPAIKMLDAESRSSDEAAKGAYSWMPTDLGAGIFLAPYNLTKWVDHNGTPGMGMFMISAQQMFPNHRSQHASFDFMRAQSSINRQKKAVWVNDLLYIARKNMYEWMVLEKKLKVLDDNDRLLRFMMQSAEIRYKNNLGQISAYYKTQAALSNEENKRIAIENEIIQKRIAINTVMNRSPDIPFSVDSNIVWNDFNSTMFDSAALMIRKSDIQVLDRAMEVNNLERQATLAALKPTFGIRFDHMFRWTGRPMQFSLMGMMRLPLFGKSSILQQTKAESLIWANEALKNQQQLMINEATGEAQSKLETLSLKKKQMKLYEDQILPALRKNFQTMQLGYEQNTEELFTLFDAWEALNMTQIEYLDQLQQALLIQADLQKILELNQ